MNQDRKALIRLAAALPTGSEERRVILSGLIVRDVDDYPTDACLAEQQQVYQDAQTAQGVCDMMEAERSHRVASPDLKKLFPVVHELVDTPLDTRTLAKGAKALRDALTYEYSPTKGRVTFGDSNDIEEEAYNTLWEGQVKMKQGIEHWQWASHHHPHDPAGTDAEGETDIEYPGEFTWGQMAKVLWREVIKKVELAVRIKIDPRKGAAILKSHARLLVPIFEDAVKKADDWQNDKDVWDEMYRETLDSKYDALTLHDDSEITIEWDRTFGRTSVVGSGMEQPITTVAKVTVDFFVGEPPELDYSP